MTPVLLVHGAWHGAWCWERVLGPLRDAGMDPHTIDLPGHGDSPAPLGDLHGDADAVKRELDEIGEPTVLVGHSYGGMVITEAASHPLVRTLVYVCAFLPEPDASLMDEGPGRPRTDGAEPRPMPILLSDDGSTMSVDRPRAGAFFYNDCDEQTQAWAAARVDDQPMASFTQSPRVEGPVAKPSTYVVCTLDQTIAPSNQRRMGERADHVVELESGHSPFLSRPAELAETIASAAAAGG